MGDAVSDTIRARAQTAARRPGCLWTLLAILFLSGTMSGWYLRAGCDATGLPSSSTPPDGGRTAADAIRR